MSDVIALVCPDGTVQVARNILWRVSQLVRDMFSSEAEVDKVPLQYPSQYVRCLILACDELWMTGAINLSTVDSIRALVVASYLQVMKLWLFVLSQPQAQTNLLMTVCWGCQADLLLQHLRVKLQLANDVDSVLLDQVNRLKPSVLGLPVISSFLQSQKRNDQYVSNVLAWACREDAEVMSRLKCDLTLTADSDVEFTRLARLVIDGKAFGTELPVCELPE